MRRLLIVDDEPIIVDGLYELFQEAGHLELDICKACSSDEALEILSRMYVDVVVSDIRMPGINGLQLLEIVMQRWPGCRLIMLSGYDEFDYVYKAIQYKGVSYLLKTEGDAKILQAVENCLEEIEQSARNSELLVKTTLKLKSAMPLLQKEFFAGILKGHPAELAQQQLDELEIPLRADEPVLMLLGRLSRPADADTMSAIEMGFSMKFAMDQYLDTGIISVSIMQENAAILWLIQPGRYGSGPDGDGDEDFNGYKKTAMHLKRILETVQNFARESMKVRISFAMDREPVHWRQLAEKYASLDYLLNSKLEPGAEILITHADAFSAAPDKKSRLSWTTRSFDNIFTQFEALKSYLENGMKDEFHSLFSTVQAQLHELCCCEYALLIEAYARISLFFISHINRFDLMETLAPDADAGRLFRADQFGTWEEAFRFFQRIADSIIEIQGSENRKRSVAAVSKVRKYVEEHLSGDLSLASLSDQVYFNPQYLSKLFKKVTGMNLLSYINELKLSKVKELLSMNDIRIHEIGVHVGFFSAPYFTRFFKKSTGMTPQEYRNNIIVNQVNKG